MNVSIRIAGQEDLGAAYGRAVRAARRGDLVELEEALAKLRRLNSISSGTVGTALRTMARCVRSHPSAGASEPRAAAS
jgi:hypothetical protein